MNWLFIAVSFSVVFVAVFSFFCCRGLFLLQGNVPRRLFYITCSRPAPWSFFIIMKCFCRTCEALYTTVRTAAQAAGFSRSGRIDLLLAQKYELLQSNSCLLGCERVMETRAKFHFSWVFTSSATLSSLRNWANNDRYRLRPSTSVKICWSSSRLQPLQNYNLIKFALIRQSALSHDRNLWNFRGAPDETTCFAVFFSVSKCLNFIFAWNCFNVCANKLSLSFSATNYTMFSEGSGHETSWAWCGQLLRFIFLLNIVWVFVFRLWNDNWNLQINSLQITTAAINDVKNDAERFSWGGRNAYA